MDTTTGQHHHRLHVTVTSHTPGRLRFKLQGKDRSADTLQKIQRQIQSVDGIFDVTANPVTGSITVRYDHHQIKHTAVYGLLRDVDIVAEAFLGDESGAEPTPVAFVDAIKDINKRLYGVTGIPIDLTLVLPVAFVGAGLWSIAKNGLMIEKIPGWLFLWFALDTFVKLHPEQHSH